MKNIVLTGFMASGKTTVGKELSKIMDFKFYDTDEMIQNMENKSINDIFLISGEEYFRALENKISNEFFEISNAVISTGGGFVLDPQNIENLRKNSVIVNLNVCSEIILKRYEKAKATRPLMNKQSIDDVLKKYDERKKYYRNCDISIDIVDDIETEEICDIIKDKYYEFLKQYGGKE